jgi:ketopantoate reductase
MRVLVVGAGAVGVVLHRALEQQKGNELTFLLRPGRKLGLVRTKILDTRTGELRVRERPSSVELGQKRPGYDTVLFCVRADQLSAAIQDVGELAAGVRVATIAPGPEGLALLRTRYPGHPSVRLGPAFMAYPEGDTVVLWHPPLVKTPVCHEDGGAESAAFAEELAAALDAGGVPARPRDKMLPGVDSATDAMAPLLAAYALAGYDADKLTDDRALLGLASDAIAETLTLAGAPGFAGAIARRATAPVVRVALQQAVPRLPGQIRAMWRTHAPKIDAQTRAALRELAKRAREGGHKGEALDEMVRRLDARVPLTSAQ